MKIEGLRLKDQVAIDSFLEPEGKKLKDIEFIKGSVRMTFEDSATLEFDAVGPAGSRVRVSYTMRVTGKFEV